MLSDILDLKKRILMAHRVRNVKMLNRTKFCGRPNRSKYDRDSAIFKFQDSSRRYLGFSKIKIFTVGRHKKAELRRLAKFGRNR